MAEASEPASGAIKTERPGRALLRVTLSRPDRSNAISRAMIAELVATIAQAESDPLTRLIVLRGSGKHFCSGAEIAPASPGSAPAGSAPPQGPSLTDLLLQWDAFPKPTVAFVQGACIGAALALASCCDVVIASPDAFFSMPEVRLGMIPGLLPFFVRAVGRARFRRYGLSGERFTAQTALECGLVSEIVEPAQWDETEARLQDAFLHAAPRAMAAIKREAARFADVPIEPSLFAHSEKREGPEIDEGKASFREKRKPSWYLP